MEDFVKMVVWRSCSSLLVALVVGCADRADRTEGALSTAPPQTDGSPLVVLVDSAVLAEPDSLPFGRFVDVAVDGKGRIYLTNGGAGGQILRYSRNGDFELAWGRRGSGPGEYQGPSMVHPFPGDTIGAIMDVPTGRFTVVDLRNGAVREEFPVPFQGTGKQWYMTDSTATFGLPLNSAIVGVWHLGQDSAQMIGALPTDLMSAFSTYVQYGHLEVIPWGEGYLAQIPALPGLHLLDREGTITRQIAVPARRRRGQAPDLLSQHARLKADGKPFKHLGSLSATLGILSTGEVAMVQVDLDAVKGPRRMEFSNVKYYVSILSPDLSRACLDALVPFVSESEYPFLSLAGDTLVGLSRRVLDNDVVRTIVYRYKVSSEGCEWVPL